MSRGLALLLSSMVLAAGADSEPQAPSPWRYNTRSRTGSGIALQQEGEIDAAGRAFGTALGLAPGDPLMQFNAGTAGLAAAGPQAIELLQAAAQGAADELRPSAYYNLGNAQLIGEDFPAAIDSYQASLRLAPDNPDAKHNLELAMRKLQEEQQQQQNDSDEQEQEQREERQQEQEEQKQQQQQQQEDQEQQQDPSKSPLPNFEEQPDMTAEQAAAILEAVENLEREQRRKQALEQLKRAKGDRDW